MARFDVYTNPDRTERKLIPFLLDVQSDHIKGIQTRIVVPLWTQHALSSRLDNVNPEFEIAGQQVVMDTPALGAVPVTALQKKVTNLSPHQLAIQDALDTLFGGH